MTYRKFITLVLFSFCLAGCGAYDGPVTSKTRLMMGTLVEIRAGGNVDTAIEKAFDEIARVEKVFSVYIPESEVSRINSLRPGEKLRLTGETFALIKKAVEYNKITDGAFDITVKPLVDLWRRAKKDKRLPGDDEIRDALAVTGSDKIILDDSAKTISFAAEGMALDLGGIAKGYATDRAIAVLKANGVRNAIVNSGGDMYCLGRRSKDMMWKVGVKHPRDENKLLFEMRLEDKAVDTSGDYEKYFLLGGKRYSHIIDPRTGYPVGDNAVSATVVADDSAAADIFATALCVLGDFKDIKDIDALVVVKDGDRLKIKMTEGFKSKYGLTEEKY